MKPRLASVDALRGIIMIVMALDHVRDFFHAGAMSGSPTDLAKTTAALFLTRWITHFCMPVFMFTAGLGIALRTDRTGGKSAVSSYLWKRGLWLILLELTVMQLAYNSSFSIAPPVFLLVLFVFGLCMLAMSVLIYVPVWLLAPLAVLTIAIERPGAILFASNRIIAPYPFIPWIGVMAAGFCFAPLLQRRRVVFWTGVAMTTAFLLIRAINRYGDPAPWGHQKSALFTVLSFLNCTKYPVSPDFLLMTLGPALILLAWLSRRTFSQSNPLIVFGRVPLFYFIAHFYAIRILALIMALFRYGPAAVNFMTQRLPSMGGPRQLFPPDFGYSLPVVFAVWALIVVSLYPLCREWDRRFRLSSSSPQPLA